MCAPASTVALYPAWSSNRTAAAWMTGPSRVIKPAAMAATTSTAGGMIMVSGVRCLPDSVSLVSSAAILAIRGSSLGASPRP